MRILFAGTPETAVPSLQQLIDDGHNVIGVLTRTDAPVGRKRVLTPSPVAQRATELGLPIIKVDRFDEQSTDTIEQIKELNVDLGAVVAYGALIPQDVLDLPTHGWVNLHFSRLPRYRGAAPIQSAIINQESSTGADVFQLEVGLDTGPVFASLDRGISPSETAGEVLEDLAITGAALLSNVARQIEAGDAQAVSQTGEPSWAPKLRGLDGRIDPAKTAGEVRARINGTTPEPGAWAMFQPAHEEKPQRLKLGGARPADANTELPAEVQPGTLIAERRRVLLMCADGPIELTEVQPAGKKMMRAVEWARGAGEDLKLQTSLTHPETF